MTRQSTQTISARAVAVPAAPRSDQDQNLPGEPRRERGDDEARGKT